MSTGSFGRVSAPSLRSMQPSDAIAAFRNGAGVERYLAYGNGRSYGDSCLLKSGSLVTMRANRRVLSFDPQTGLLHAEAGAMLSEIIAETAPYGWFLPVTPGTKFVTLGGAIANDIHGKNHHVQGTFGRHVVRLMLLRSNGRTRILEPGGRDPLFAATIGGMGLTGIILEASIRMMRVPGLDVVETATPFSSLDGFFELCAEADDRHDYVVAWIDQLATGRSEGRGVLLAGRHSEDGRFRPAPEAPRISVPFTPPVNLINQVTVSAFNRLYHFSKAHRRGTRRTGYDAYFYPLDAVGNWNALYGPNGFFQHQSVVPEEDAPRTVARLLQRSRESGHASFLTVLKRFGSLASPGLLSFARPGYTLTMDFANRGVETNALLAELDAITIAAGGAVNPYKDARMSATTFRKSFPRWQELEANRDPAFTSDFWERTVTFG